MLLEVAPLPPLYRVLGEDNLVEVDDGHVELVGQRQLLKDGRPLLLDFVLMSRRYIFCQTHKLFSYTIRLVQSLQCIYRKFFLREAHCKPAAAVLHRQASPELHGAIFKKVVYVLLLQHSRDLLASIATKYIITAAVKLTY